MAITDNLVAFWELGEASGNRLDSAGSNHLVPDAGFPGNQAGKVGNAPANTNGGTPNYLGIADNAALSMGDIDFTIAGWFSDNFTGVNTSYLSKWSSGNEEYRILLSSVTGGWEFHVRDVADTTTSTCSTPGIGALDTFYFVVAWHNATANTISVQMDLGTINSSGTSGGVRDSTNAFRLFALADGAGGAFGTIDQLGIWKRVLTSDERSFLYNGGAGRAYTDLTGGPTAHAVSGTGLKRGLHSGLSKHMGGPV